MYFLPVFISILLMRRPPKSLPSAMTRLPSASNFVPAAWPLGERKMVACLVFGSNFQMLPAPGYLPEGSLHNGENGFPQKKTSPPPGPTELPPVENKAPT